MGDREHFAHWGADGKAVTDGEDPNYVTPCRYSGNDVPSVIVPAGCSFTWHWKAEAKIIKKEAMECRLGKSMRDTKEFTISGEIGPDGKPVGADGKSEGADGKPVAPTFREGPPAEKLRC
jgi:hypothetical protein